MSKNLFIDGLEINGHVTLTEMTTETILKDVDLISIPNEFNKGVLLDIETTGIQAGADSIIEIALREFYFDNENNFKGFGSFYNEFNDPGFSIPPEITNMTGITDNDVIGKKIDWNSVNEFCESSSIIIAHNASFDCPFLKAHESFTKKDILWGCSMSQIPWIDLGFKARGLELLALFHGFYYRGHRALIDVDAIGYIFSKGNYLRSIIIQARKQEIKVMAKGADFDSKDLLKSRGFRWNAENKYWMRNIYQEDFEEVKDWLEREVYKKNSFKSCVFKEISIYSRFG